MKKRKGLKKFLKVLLALIVIGLIIYACFSVKTKSIFIYNNTFLSDQEIIDRTSLKDYPSFFLTTGSKIKDELNEPFIKDVKIKRAFLLELHVEIEEYRPLFIRQENNTIVLENKVEIPNNYEISLPILINYVPSTKYAKFIEELAKIDKSITDKISEIKYDPNDYDEDRFLLYMNDKNAVYITLTKMDLLNKYNELITKIDGNEGILYLDSGNYFEVKD